MRVTCIGHAGLFIETSGGSILCDPWFSPSYLASWFPFPSNEEIDLRALGRPDYLYVSHLHHDHFDEELLRSCVDPATRVLLPDFPTGHLRSALSALGFHHFIETRDAEPLELEGLRVMVHTLTTPTDGPIGDSGLALDDGTACVFNQNDSRPVDLAPLTDFGPFDAHFLQFSGAIWYPMVYELPPATMAALGRQKRANQLARATRYARELGASFVFPFAGPPCFLDDELFELNDLEGDETNIFPDQTVFIDHLRAEGIAGGRLIVPGTRVELVNGTCEVSHALPEAELQAIFSDKRAYLESYRERRRADIQSEKRAWPVGSVDLVASLREWWEPLLAEAELTCAGVNARMLLESGEQAVVVDFMERRVYRWRGEECRYRFTFEPGTVESCVARHVEDWVNELFLSCRFTAVRDGPYNEYVYTFFKSLSPERMRHVESFYAGHSPVDDLWRCGDYLVQRRCPHRQADLSRFATVEDGILTCHMHGWSFELATGRCLTSDDRRLYVRPAGEDAQAPDGHRIHGSPDGEAHPCPPVEPLVP